MRTLRRLLSHLSNHLELSPDEMTIGSLIATLDYFHNNPTEYLELFQ